MSIVVVLQIMILLFVGVGSFMFGHFYGTAEGDKKIKELNKQISNLRRKYGK